MGLLLQELHSLSEKVVPGHEPGVPGRPGAPGLEGDEVPHRGCLPGDLYRLVHLLLVLGEVDDGAAVV